MILASGTRLGAYEIVSLIGKGGMGEVYSARDTRLHRTVAVKVLPREQMADPDRRRRFLQEARAASALNHPNIVTLHDIAHDGDVDFLVMEHVAGTPLDAVIARDRLPPERTFVYALQIARALAAAHAAGVVHRDIKPANILITADRQVKVLDFGLAKLAEPADEVAPTTVVHPGTEPGVVVGTIAYMAPEQARGEPIDARSDLFSLGAVLFEMATGRRPFARRFDWTPPAAQDIEPGLRALVLRLLQPDPARRYQTAGDLISDLERLEHKHVEPVASSLRWMWIGAATLTVIASIMIAWMLAGRKRTLQAVELTRVTSDAGFTAFPALSRDGRLLVYASDRGGGPLNLWVQQIGPGDPVRITNSVVNDSEPSFSPDATFVVFRSELDGGGVYTVPALGGTPRRIAPQGRRPRFSPDGQWIAYWVGERHQFSSNSLYVVRSTGGEPRRLASTFFSAFDPLWSPDGRQLLIVGAETDKAKPAERYDWWMVPVDGGTPVATGALPALRAKGVFPVWNETGDWLDDVVVFAASTSQYASAVSTGAVDQSSIWSLRFATNPWRPAGDPRQLTVASRVEVEPSLARAADGTLRLALTSATRGGNSDIWALPVRANDGIVTGEMRRVTSTVVENTYPSISRDGRRVAFSSERSRNVDLFIRDLPGGTETALTATDVNEFSPRISADGSKVLYYVYRPDQKPSFSFWVVSASGGLPRQVCSDCDGPLYDWSTAAMKVIWRDLPPGRPGRVRVHDIESGKDEVVVEHSKYSLTLPRLSTDDRWLVFNAVITQTQRQIFVTPLDNWRAPQDPSQWIAITDGQTPDRNAVWSPAGNLLYFLSERDGFHCFWAQRLDATSKRPLGEPFAVQHFHQAQKNWEPSAFTGIQLSVGPDSLVFPLREQTGNIWLATLAAR
jgi:eukaryotic-like serine/threonine-protein kinase